MKTPKSPLHLFEGYGVELEYMIVDRATLTVQPIADQLIYDVVGSYANEIEMDEIAWSNELVLHVIELKTNGPAPRLTGLSQAFYRNIQHINNILATHHAMLLPSGAHPFMCPFRDAKLWPHDYNEIYEAYNQIFNCQGHGWSNLQSTHLNLPFANDDEFARLHTAIRLLLPIIPALTASTPIIDGKFSGHLDMRMEFYRKNQEKIPAIAGNIVPEVINSANEYQEKILKRMYAEIAPFDKNHVLQYEWLNSRGAIPRFDRNTIEIRVIDVQECAEADLAILALIEATLKCLVAEKWQKLTKQQNVADNVLSETFLKCIQTGQATLLTKDYLEIFAIPNEELTAKELWQFIFKQMHTEGLIEKEWEYALNIILKQGNLAERILYYMDNRFDKNKINACYLNLAQCLAENKLFIPSDAN